MFLRGGQVSQGVFRSTGGDPVPGVLQDSWAQVEVVLQEFVFAVRGPFAQEGSHEAD